MAYFFQKLNVNDVVNSLLKSYLIVSFNNIRLPLTIFDSNIVQDTEIPEHPVASNSYIGDTVWSKPIQITISAFVNQYDLDDLNQVVDKSKKSPAGFTVTNAGVTYKNMYVKSYTVPVTPEISNGFKVQIVFQQILKVTTLITSAFKSTAIANVADSSVVDAGKAAAKKVDNKTYTLKAFQMTEGKYGNLGRELGLGFLFD